MGKHKNAAKGGRDAQKGAFPTPSSHGVETGDTAQSLMGEVASMEEVFLPMGAPSKMPFRFTQWSRSSSEWSLSPEHQWDCSMTPNIRHSIASRWEWLLEKGEVINPHLHTY